jgi:hypothetical protein
MFQLSKLCFGEKPNVSFSVAMDPDKVRTKPGQNYAVTPVALTYKNKQTYFEPLVPMFVAFSVPDTGIIFNKYKTFSVLIYFVLIYFEFSQFPRVLI